MQQDDRSSQASIACDSCTDTAMVTLEMAPEQEQGSSRKSHAGQGALREVSSR